MGNHFILKDFQTLADQQCLNVYCYENTSGSGDGIRLATAFIADIIVAQLVTIQASAVLHTTLEYQCIEDPDDFGLVVVNETGTIVGDYLPQYDAFAIRFDRATRLVRNGQKRIPGVPEAGQNGGQLTGGYFASLQLIAEQLVTVLTDVDGNEYTPRIWRRASGTLTQGFFSIQTATASNFVSTQVTRKRGRGA